MIITAPPKNTLLITIARTICMQGDLLCNTFYMEGSKNIKYTVGSVSVSSISSRYEKREKYVGVT